MTGREFGEMEYLGSGGTGGFKTWMIERMGDEILITTPAGDTVSGRLTEYDRALGIRLDDARIMGDVDGIGIMEERHRVRMDPEDIDEVYRVTGTCI